MKFWLYVGRYEDFGLVYIMICLEICYFNIMLIFMSL